MKNKEFPANNSLLSKDISYGKAVDKLIKQSKDQSKVTNILWDACFH